MDSLYGSKNPYKEEQLSKIKTDNEIKSKIQKALEEKKQLIFSERDMQVFKIA